MHLLHFLPVEKISSADLRENLLCPYVVFSSFGANIFRGLQTAVKMVFWTHGGFVPC